MCEVLFFGTAFSIDSQRPAIHPGTLSCIATGIERARVGKRGWESCLEYKVVKREALEPVVADNRGRKAGNIEDVVIRTVAILSCSGNVVQLK